MIVLFRNLGSYEICNLVTAPAPSGFSALDDSSTPGFRILAEPASENLADSSPPAAELFAETPFRDLDDSAGLSAPAPKASSFDDVIPMPIFDSMDRPNADCDGGEALPIEAPESSESRGVLGVLGELGRLLVCERFGVLGVEGESEPRLEGVGGRVWPEPSRVSSGFRSWVMQNFTSVQNVSPIGRSLATVVTVTT